ncbi:MAG TPA: 2-succinyl-5-enolpyruvyl-6-hydroxy-3-cyclohexene-1-carboxylic-acid synthase [Actinobacteria bacterium]|nr:2-succinyl-5-enolpyruvyl-6-hydroxy-3-cyclohexene-1-carboxylic-acid synthase [Actinomycetota bacterium]
MEPAAVFATRLVAALADLGLRTALLSPGSRHTPLAVAFAVEPRIDHHVVWDERSAAFVALGAAKATGRPVAVLTTSGTAGAHHLPAIVEASEARVPLLSITADRPPEVRGAGAPQTTDQTRLFGVHVRAFLDPGVPDDDVARAAPSLAARAWAAAVDAPAGPVHLNVPFREPLTVPEVPAPPEERRHVAGIRVPEPEDLDRLAARLAGRRVLIVAGGPMRPGFGAAAAMVAAELAAPVLADVQCRFPSPATIHHPDLVVEAFDLHRPDVVLRIGALPTSKALWRRLEVGDVPQVHLDDVGARDPLGTASWTITGDPAATLAALVGRLEPGPEGWLEAWRREDRRAASHVEDVLAAAPFPNEPSIARTVHAAAPAGTLVVGSSMPIRDVDAFAGPPRTDLHVLANRGANGIDGIVATAAGVALVGEGPVVALSGDLAVLHDAASLRWVARRGLDVRLVVVDNDGGGIFHLLPQAETLDEPRFEELFATPHGTDLVAVAEAFGVPASSTISEAELRRDLVRPGPRLLRLPTDRRANVELQRRLRSPRGARGGDGT